MMKPITIEPGMTVTAMGLGRFGGQVEAIRYLAEQGAHVMVTDQADPTTLQASIDALAHLPNITYRFGPHQPSDFANAQMILVSPGISPQHPLLIDAQQRDAKIITEMQLFLERCLAPIIAISGTVGKSTTASMLVHLLNRTLYATDKQQLVVGGNFGNSLLPRMHTLSREKYVVLELSSFQLHWLRDIKPRFEIAVLTNFFPHHLGWHQTVEHYRASKQLLFAGQTPADIAVLPACLANDFRWSTAATLLSYDDSNQSGNVGWPVDWPRHWRANANAVLALADKLGIPPSTIVDTLSSFPGLPHRLELVGDNQQRRFVNDSKATSPWATQAAVAAQRQAFWLILGGAKSTDDPSELLQLLKKDRQLRGICWMGPGGQQWSARFGEPNCVTTHCDDLASAVAWCWRHSQPGETILLSPGCPSFNEFVNFEQRGERFQTLSEQYR